jgi:hypothetical protein
MFVETYMLANSYDQIPGIKIVVWIFCELKYFEKLNSQNLHQISQTCLCSLQQISLEMLI